MRISDWSSDVCSSDLKSLCFDSQSLTEPLEILGAPELKLEIEVDQPTAFLAVRLCDVAPDGSSKRVTYAILNLNHRDGREPPKPLTPGARFKITVPLIKHRSAELREGQACVRPC